MPINLAIIIERDTLSVHEARLLDIIQPAYSVTLLRAGPDELTSVRAGGWFYRFILGAETWLTSLAISRIKEHRRRVPTQDVASLRSATDSTFDLILNLTHGRVKRNLLPRSERGVLNLHYGNVRTGIEGPPGFGESCHEDNATGCWLTRSDHDSDTVNEDEAPTHGGASTPVFSARYKTKRTMCLNAESVQREGHIDIAHELIRLAGGAPFRNITLPTQPTWQKPSPLDVILYRLRTLWRELLFFASTRLRGRELIFSVGVVNKHWSETDLSGGSLSGGRLSGVHIVPNPPGSYLADPFVVERDGRSVIYAEEFDLKSERGRISWLELKDGEAAYRGTLIEEPYHMSFPFVFEFGGELVGGLGSELVGEFGGDLYMVPETFEAREIGLYRCTQFPDEWQRCGTLMDDVEASDTMIFKDPTAASGTNADRWWMLTNLRPEGALDFYSRLYLFWSDDPTSNNWTPHPLNPVLIDAEGGRNGGLLRGLDGTIHRVGQLQSIMTYGAGWSIFKVKGLSDTDYSETHVASIPPTQGPIVGGHHLHGTPSRTVLDVLQTG